MESGSQARRICPRYYYSKRRVYALGRFSLLRTEFRICAFNGETPTKVPRSLPESRPGVRINERPGGEGFNSGFERRRRITDY